MFQYRNVGLDSEVIGQLQTLYRQQFNYNVEKAHAMAIMAHVWDVYLKGVMSIEETERIYTGAPMFFKWKYSKVKNRNGLSGFETARKILRLTVRVDGRQ